MSKDLNAHATRQKEPGQAISICRHGDSSATELLEKCKAKVVVHKAEAEFIKGLSSSDMIKTDNGDKVDVGGI